MVVSETESSPLSTESVKEIGNLPKTFDSALRLVDDIETGAPGKSPEESKSQIISAIDTLERCTKMVTSLQLFSRNETIDEVTTSSLRYLLLPSLLGDLTNIIPIKSARGRLPIAERVIAYYSDFLKRCQDYEVFHGEVPELKESSGSNADPMDLKQQMRDRLSKVERFKEMRANEEKIKNLSEKDDAIVDEEAKRELHLLKLKVAINKCVDNLNIVLQERELLKQRFNSDVTEVEIQKTQLSTAKKTANDLTRPAILILTRDEVQKTVLGAGYPSVPTMTLDEWYEAQCQSNSQNLPESGVKSKTGDPDLDSRLEQQEKLEREEEQEARDDPALLQKRRQFDAYKDDHRRGSGNTIGKG